MSIVVGIDGSEHAEKALRWALHEAALRSTTLSVVTAFRVRPFDPEITLDHERRAAREMVEQTLDRLVGANHGDVEISASAIMGRGAADAILRHDDADLIVVGSRGRGGFSGLLLGSVSHQLAAHAAVPVAVVPHTLDVSAQGDHTTAIVVGVDGSPSSRWALRWAVDEARVRDVPLTAVYAYRSVREALPFGVEAPVGDAQAKRLEQQASRTALAALEQWTSEAGSASGVRVVCEVAHGAPAKALTFDAADESALLVVGRRGLGGFRGLLLGSVSQQCLHHARGPVVVTPAVY